MQNGIIERVGDRGIYEGQKGIPTKLGKTASGEIVIGDEVNRGNCVPVISRGRDLKSALRAACWHENNDDNFIEEDIIEAKENVEIFLTALFQSEFQRDNKLLEDNYTQFVNEVDRIIFGAPALTVGNERDGTDPYNYANCLKDILCKIFPKAYATPIYEPRLAGQSLGILWNDNFEGNVLVIDLGGGTNDFSVISLKNGKIDLVAPTVGGAGPGGNKFDALIKDYFTEVGNEITNANVDSTIKLLKEGVFCAPYKPKSTGEGCNSKYGEFKFTGRSANELIITYDSIRHGANYVDLKDILFKSFEKVAEKVLAYWKCYISGKVEINRIFFVGGGARIHPLRELIVKKINGKYKTNYSCDYFGEKLNSHVGEMDEINCSNIVARGAINFEGIVERPIGFKFAFNKNYQYDIEFLNTTTQNYNNGYFCTLQLRCSFKEETDNINGGRLYYKLSMLLYDEKGNKLSASPCERSFLQKRIYFYFKIEHGTRVPHSSFSISLDKVGLDVAGEIYNILIHLSYNRNGDFYALFLPCGDDDTPLYPDIKKEAIVVYNAEKRILDQDYKKIKKFMEDYIHGTDKYTETN